MPTNQQSWAGKAHSTNEEVVATPLWHETTATNSPRSYPWFLLNSTPASCIQIALGHLLEDRPRVDLVICGPHVGCNITSILALSSGTTGAALEATLCGYRAVAISFARATHRADTEEAFEMSQHAIQVIDKLYTQGEWTPGTLYSVTIPCLVGVAREIAWTSVYANTWRKPECFEELMPRTGYIEQKPDPERTGTAIKEEQHSPTQTETSMVGQERFFKWAPKLDKVVEDSMHAPIGTDAWAIQTGKTSITKLSANPT
ncbi:sure-like protein [Aureobasidium pullulans]|nr:sure-like protein [Aureobasidium pullulans]